MSSGRRADPVGESASGGVGDGPHESRGPGGAVECLALEDGGVRLDRVRPSWQSWWAGDRRAPDEELGDRERRVAPCRADPRSGDFKIPARESVLVQSATGTAEQPEFSAAVGSVVLDLSQQPDVAAIISPIEYPNAGLISRPALGARPVRRGLLDKAKDKIAPIMAAVLGAQAGHPGMTVEEFDRRLRTTRSASGSSGTWAGSR